MAVMALRYQDRRVSEDILRKLELSWQRAAQIQKRNMYCPYCGRKIAEIPVDQKEIVFAKCHNCKYEGPLDPAYFRRMRAYRNIGSFRHRRIIR